MKTVLPPLGEIAARGERLYGAQLREKLEGAYHGKFAVINVETGEYEIGDDHLSASQRAAQRWPQGLLYAIRIGSPTLGHVGARFRKKSE